MISGAAFKRFFSTPKGLLIIILTALAVLAAPHEGIGRVAPGMLSAVAAAGIVDALIIRWKQKAWEFPDGAVLTAMFIAMVFSSIVPWRQVAITSVVGVVSKYAFRSRWLAGAPGPSWHSRNHQLRLKRVVDLSGHRLLGAYRVDTRGR